MTDLTTGADGLDLHSAAPDVPRSAFHYGLSLLPKPLLLITLLIGLPACDIQRGHDQAAQPAAPELSDSVRMSRLPSAAVAADHADPRGVSRDSSAKVALEGEGLRIFLVPSGSSRPIPFGTPAETAVERLSRVLGEPPQQQGENLDCGASYSAWSSGLTIWVARGEMVGWSVARQSDLTTASGIGMGSTRSDLEAAYRAEVFQSTLGVEFNAGGLAGLLESQRPDATILNLWAGVVCLAR